MKTRYFSIALRRLRWLGWLALLGGPLAGTAQTPVTPTSPAAPTPLAYKSAFEGYQPFTDDNTVGWKQANDNVARIGGWRAYAKQVQEAQQAQEADAKPSNPPDPANKPGETAPKGKP